MSELGLSHPVSEVEVLAAVVRAQVQESLGANIGHIANHLGWRPSGAATRRLRPRLAQFVSEGLVTTVEVPRHRERSQKWEITPAGRRRLASEGPVELPESPQHRRWRQERDLAAWALEDTRTEAESAAREAYDLFTADRPGPLTGADINQATSQFAQAMRGFATAIRMCEEWPEPSDDQPDPHKLYQAALFLPDNAKKRRR